MSLNSFTFNLLKYFLTYCIDESLLTELQISSLHHFMGSNLLFHKRENESSIRAAGKDTVFNAVEQGYETFLLSLLTTKCAHLFSPNFGVPSSGRKRKLSSLKSNDILSIEEMLDKEFNSTKFMHTLSDKTKESLIQTAEQELLNIREVACLVCGMLHFIDEVTLLKASEISGSFLKNMKSLLHYSTVLPPLPKDLIKQYNCSVLFRNKGNVSDRFRKNMNGLLLDRNAITEEGIYFCLPCLGALKQNKLPKTAIANNNATGNIPFQMTDMEVRLCSPVICGMSVTRVYGLENSVKGHTVMFNGNLKKVSQNLPREDLAEFCYIATTTKQNFDVKHLHFAKVSVNNVKKCLQLLCKWRPEEFARSCEDMSSRLNKLRKDINTLSHIPSSIQEYFGEEEDISRLQQFNGLQDGYTQYDGNGGTFVFSNNTGPDLNTLDANTVADFENVSDDQTQKKEKQNAYVYKLGELVKGDKKKLLAYCFPNCFPFGRGDLREKRKVAISEEELYCRFLRLSTRVFSRSSAVIANFFDIVNMKRGSSIVNLSTSADSAAKCATVTSEQFRNAITFTRLLENARKTGTPFPNLRDYDVGEAFSILSTCEVACRNMFNTKEERLSGRKKFFALQNFFGNYFLWVTFNPSLQNSTIAIEFITGEKCTIDLDVSKTERHKFIDCDPAANARFFEKLKDIFIKCILRFDKKRTRPYRDQGALGTIKCYGMATESTVRTDLHVHCLLGGLGIPQTREDLLKALEDDDVKAQLQAAVCSMVSSSYPNSMNFKCTNCNSSHLVGLTNEDLERPTHPLPKSTL
eukprot:Nk52_evm1s176 gene=Nk52_evmTU1s176